MLKTIILKKESIIPGFLIVKVIERWRIERDKEFFQFSGRMSPMGWRKNLFDGTF
jgi:hypothetical protein